jgi:hypothetical protein
MHYKMSKSNTETTSNETSHSRKEYQQIMDALHSVQQNERYMYERIRQINMAPVFDSQEKQNVIEQIRKMQITRKALYASLIEKYNQKNQTIEENEFEIKNGVKMVHMVNEELDQIKNEIDEMDMVENQKERMTQVKNYEWKRYHSILNVLKLVAYVLVSITVIMFLQWTILPSSIAWFLYTIILSIGLISIIYRIYDIRLRNNMYFDKYDFIYNPKIHENDSSHYTPIETENNINQSTSKKTAQCTLF